MQRQRDIAVDDEEELLRLQDQFASSRAQGDVRPAAKVTRIRRPAAASADSASPASRLPSAAPQPNQHTSSCREHGPQCQGGHPASQSQQDADADLLAAMQTAMRGIVGEVQERAASAPEPPCPPTAAPAASAAFPEATHRKLSKFALGRQRQRAADTAVAAPASAAMPTAMPPFAAGGAGRVPLSEEAQIDAENRHLLAAMSAEQVAEAREEAVHRFPPAAIEFLRRRGAHKTRTAAASPPTAAAVPGSASHATAGQQAATQLPSTSASSGGGAMNTPHDAKHVQPPRQQQRHHQPLNETRPSEASAADWASRLRFDINGRVVGLRPAGIGSDVAPADVAERDPLRLNEGMAVEGYSVQEACLLARSRLPQQRVLALRLLAAVLAHSRPSAAHGTPTCVPLPPAVAAELQQQQQQGATAPKVQWVAMWHHALHTAEVVLLLRRSLDDSHPAVAAAAAEALGVLVGAAGPAGAAEEEAAEAADAASLTGWPAAPMRHMQRPTASSASVAAPMHPGHHSRGGEAGAEGEGSEESDETLDERQLAKVDPLTGLLHMQLPERAAYLMGPARVAAAAEPLLSILVRCCQAGKDVADRVLDAPGMLDALKGLLDAPPPPAVPDGGAGGRAGAEVATDPASAAFYAARPKALRLLRQLAASSKAAARRLAEEGLTRFALDHLLRPAALEGSSTEARAARDSTPANASSSSSSSIRSVRQLGQLTEALRLWRCFAQHGFYLALLDDAYPSLCTFFAPPPPAPEALVIAAAGQAQALSQEQVQQWCVAREAYSTAAQLCWHAARSEPQDAQVSPQCAAALAQGAVTWLAQLPWQHLLGFCTASSCSGGGSGTETPGSECGAAGRYRGGASPYPALLAASSGGDGQVVVMLGTLAACLHFVGSYWGVQVWHTAADKAEAAQQLTKLGLLPATATPETTGPGVASQPPLLMHTVGALLRQLVGGCGSTWQAQDEGSFHPASSSSGARMAGQVSATAELAVAVSRLAHTFLAPQQAAEAVAALLAPLFSEGSAARFLQAATHTDATLLQPWDAARQMHVLPLARAAVVGLQAVARVRTGCGEQAAGVDGVALRAGATDTGLALLQLLPAGDEAAALQVMAVLLGPSQLATTCAAAAACLEAAAGSKVGQLASSAGNATGTGSIGLHAGQPVRPPALPAVRQLSSLLLPGYAANWLALVPDRGQEGGEEHAAAAALEPPASSAVLRPEGSRLPLPPNWMLSELPVPPPDAGVAADPATAASCALLLALGWEEQQLGSLAGTQLSPAAVAESKLRSAVLLAFGDRNQLASGSGVVPGGAGAVNTEEEQAWEQPLARWCLGALMHRYCSTAASCSSSSSSAGAAGVSAGGEWDGCCWQQQEARQVAQHFAAVSYGDLLFGASLGTLLRRTVPLDVQLEVLHSLAEDQALHLLPPLHLLPGPAAAYLHGPNAMHTSGGGAGFGAACFGAGAPVSSMHSSGRKELDLYVKLLTEGRLERCLAAASPSSPVHGADARSALEGDGGCFAGCSAAVPLVLHRLARACFPDSANDAHDNATQESQQKALLCTILQRCCSSTSSQSGAAPRHLPLLRLLGMLLRWDTAAGQPSDAVSRERVQAIEAACSNVGMDAAAVLRFALQA